MQIQEEDQLGNLRFWAEAGAPHVAYEIVISWGGSGGWGRWGARGVQKTDRHYFKGYAEATFIHKKERMKFLPRWGREWMVILFITTV